MTGSYASPGWAKSCPTLRDEDDFAAATAGIFGLRKTRNDGARQGNNGERDGFKKVNSKTARQDSNKYSVNLIFIVLSTITGQYWSNTKQ